MAAITMPKERFSVPRLSLELTGMLSMLLGAWGGIVAFIGPSFGFDGTGARSWQWNLLHGLVFLAPGSIAFSAGIVLMRIGVQPNGRRLLADTCGLLIAICGAWFVVGPFAWPVIEGAHVFQSAGPLRDLETWIGYSLGPGALLMSLGAFIVGRARFMDPYGTSESEGSQWRVIEEVAPSDLL